MESVQFEEVEGQIQQSKKCPGQHECIHRSAKDGAKALPSFNYTKQDGQKHQWPQSDRKSAYGDQQFQECIHATTSAIIISVMVVA
jgi:hypothetical protein